jgi:hypothetical protein
MCCKDGVTKDETNLNPFSTQDTKVQSANIEKAGLMALIDAYVETSTAPCFSGKDSGTNWNTTDEFETESGSVNSCSVASG